MGGVKLLKKRKCMPTCKKCNEIVGASDIVKNGVCKDCYAKLDENELNGISNDDKSKELKKDETKLNDIDKIFLGIGALVVLAGIYFIFTSFKSSDIVKPNKPDISTIKSLAHSYFKYSSTLSEIEVIKSYEKDGKIVEIVKIGDKVCDMPMLKINGRWNALGIKCVGGL